MNRAATAVIDSSALRANLATTRKLAPDARVMAVIKADGYGHGLVTVAQALADADAFAVARLEEGMALRDAGLDQRIVLLEGVFHAEQMVMAAGLNLELVVHSPEQVAMLEGWQGSHRFPIWLKADTGMNRLGFDASAFLDARRRLTALACIDPGLHLMTHLACADERENDVTRRQLAAFAELTAGLEGERTIANSAGLMDWPESRADWVRPGIMLYGASPFPGREGHEHDLVPAMRLTSELIAVKTVRAGERVGYGGTWQAAVDTRIGIAAIGYGDGYPRHLGNGTAVRVGGQPGTLAGRVSMDLIAIDVSEAPEAAVGDEVELWGGELPVERAAERAGTIPYELLCGITKRVAMRVV